MKDIKEALQDYERAFLEMKKEAPDIDLAYELLERSASAGCEKAKYALGTWYLHGAHNLPLDLIKAVDLLEDAAMARHPEAMFDLANCYEKGHGVREDFTKAFDLYLQAALRGERQSVYEVGRCYFHGIGVEKDERLADIWLERAEEMELD